VLVLFSPSKPSRSRISVPSGSNSIKASPAPRAGVRLPGLAKRNRIFDTSEFLCRRRFLPSIFVAVISFRRVVEYLG